MSLSLSLSFYWSSQVKSSQVNIRETNLEREDTTRPLPGQKVFGNGVVASQVNTIFFSTPLKQCSYILNSVRFRTDSNSVRKTNSIKFSEPNWIRFGNKKHI